MSWRTKHLNLTKDQKDRGVIYSSVLIVTNNPGCKSVLHEVMADDPDRHEKIRNLKDVSFFKTMARDFGYNVINEVRQS